jgi:hypothetical protein
MKICLSIFIRNISNNHPMKGFLILLFFPLQLFAQDLQGVWVGVLHNDSANTDLHYEIVISETKGKLSGFSYTNFIVDGRSLTGIKSLVINKRFGKLFIEDNDLVYNNYPFDPPKGVRQASILELSSVEPILYGKFTTTRTKQYGKPVTGTIHLLRKSDLADSRLIEVLTGLQLTASLSFLPKREEPVASIVKSDKEKQTIPKKEAPIVSNAKTDKKEEPIVKKEEPVATTKQPIVKQPESVIASSGIKEPVKPTPEKAIVTRKVQTVQTIYFTSDSLQLELYDNGYVDGDSVSIILNGKAFLNNIRLSEKAATKMIYITPAMGDSINLVMFAENLGSISPNSGLAIIRDGKTQHRVAFSGDLERNAAIILRRKKQ